MTKHKLGLELYGPCSVTGAVPELGNTVAVLDENGRVSFHRVEGIEKSSGPHFCILFRNGQRAHDAECYMLYTVEDIQVKL